MLCTLVQDGWVNIFLFLKISHLKILYNVFFEHPKICHFSVLRIFVFNHWKMNHFVCDSASILSYLGYISRRCTVCILSSYYCPEGFHLSLGFVHSLGSSTVILGKSGKLFIRAWAVILNPQAPLPGAALLWVAWVSVCGVSWDAAWGCD